jgi:hypothetical protein
LMEGSYRHHTNLSTGKDVVEWDEEILVCVILCRTFVTFIKYSPRPSNQLSSTALSVYDVSGLLAEYSGMMMPPKVARDVYEYLFRDRLARYVKVRKPPPQHCTTPSSILVSLGYAPFTSESSVPFIHFGRCDLWPCYVYSWAQDNCFSTTSPLAVF